MVVVVDVVGESALQHKICKLIARVAAVGLDVRSSKNTPFSMSCLQEVVYKALRRTKSGSKLLRPYRPSAACRTESASEKIAVDFITGAYASGRQP